MNYKLSMETYNLCLGDKTNLQKNMFNENRYLRIK